MPGFANPSVRFQFSGTFLGRIDVLLTDVVLPSMSEPGEGASILQKPFHTKTLLHSIQDLVRPAELRGIRGGLKRLRSL